MADTAVLNLGLNSNQFDRGLASAGAKLGAFSAKSILAIGAIGGVMVAGAAAISFSLIKSASDAEETANKFNSVFSGMEKTANDTAKELAKSYGLSQRESQKLLGNTGDLLTGFDFTKKSALNLSKQVQELAGDLASFQNVDVKTASESITKALLGETESMKSLGVVVRQNTQQFRDSVKAQMIQTGATEQQAKAMVIFKQITNQSKNAIGDYAKTSKMFANQLKLTGKIWDDLKVSAGLFLKEILGAEGMLLSFNNNFRNITTNIQGFLANWRDNFKITIDWIGDNFAVLMLQDIPKIIQLSLKNSISNIAVFGTVVSDVFSVIWSDIGEDITSELLKGFTNASIEIIKSAAGLASTIKDVISGNLGVGLAIKMLFPANDVDAQTKTLSEKIEETISASLKKANFTSLLFDEDKEIFDKDGNLVKNDEYELKVKDLELKLNITDKFKKDLDDAKKEIEGVEDKAGVKSKSTKATKASGSPAGAVLKDSAQAFQIQYGNANELIQKDQLKFAKKTAKNTEKLGTTTFNVASFA